MDDYTWQKSIELRQRRRQREVFSLVLVLAIALGTAVWYFGIYARTPDFALNAALEAVQTHDVEKFHRYVDMKLLTDRAYDDLTVDFFTNDPSLTPQSRALFEKFYVLIKSQLTAGIINTVTGKIESGEFAMPQGTSLLKGRQLGIDYELFLEKSRLTSFELVSVGAINRGSGYATAELNIKDTTCGVEFPLVLVLEERSNGWQVAYLNNYRNFLDKVTPLIARDITAYVNATREIINEHNNIFAAQRQDFAALTDTYDGRISSDRRTFVVDLIEKQILPTIKMRQIKLNEVAAPPGAKYLAAMRQKATDQSVAAWTAYLAALRENRHEALENAESLLKQNLETEVRIEDIIKQAALNSELPIVP